MSHNIKKIYFLISHPRYLLTQIQILLVYHMFVTAGKTKKKKNSELMLYFDLLYLQIGV